MNEDKSSVHQAAPLAEQGTSGSQLPVVGNDKPGRATRENLLNLLRAVKPWVERGGEISGYGFYRPENPNNFFPDPESCSDEEVANHKAACEAWDRGDYKREPGSEYLQNEAGETVGHITRAPWGIGSYSDMTDEAADLLAAIDAVLNTAGAAQ